MGFPETVLLAAFAGLTIYLGLPVGRLRTISANWQALLTAAAGGVILFLVYDVLHQAIEPASAALDAARAGASLGAFAIDAAVLAGSVAVGLLSVTYVTTRLRTNASGSSATRQLAMGTAVGLGLHNFSEGLAIGQSSATGATSLALILVIGFALHNATEGFGIVAPLAGGPVRPSWAFLGAMGAIGGGPTVVGTIVGQAVVNTTLSVAFLGLAAGSILYVVIELLGVNRAFGLKVLASAGVLVGLLLGFGTDLFLKALGG